MVESVRPGVYFTPPADLPKGRHRMSREEVAAAQSERLMIAVTELMADQGYRTIGVRDIARRARVSAAAYYECFTDKDSCVFAAYDRYIEVLLSKVAIPLQSPRSWDQTVDAVLDAYVGTLGSDLVVARAFQVEMDALGRRARDARRKALMSMAVVLKARREELWPEHGVFPVDAYMGAVYALRQLASDALDLDRQPDLSRIADRVRPWVTRMLASPT